MKLCLTIGVSDANPLAPLPGALTAAEEISNWALKSGFITRIVTDEFEPVTIDRIEATLLEMLPTNDRVELFVLHFAGHGYRSGAEQNAWFPSDWNHDMRAISVEGLKRQLYRFGIDNLTIISDACRTLPDDIDIADLVLDHILPRGDYTRTVPNLDRFNAVMDGQQAFMLPGDDLSPARCVFSTVLVEGLSGLEGDAFDQYLTDCVIPESLANYSKKRISEIEIIYGLKCEPEFSTGLPRDHTIYYQRGKQIQTIAMPVWPSPAGYKIAPKDVNVDFAESYRDLEEETFEIHDSWSDHDSFDVSSDRLDTLSLSKMDVLHHILSDRVNLIIQGRRPIRIWSQTAALAIDQIETTFAYSVQIDNGTSTQLLVEFDNGIFASVVIFGTLITLVNFNNGLVSWSCFDRYINRDMQLNPSDAIITKLQKGLLSAYEVDSIAGKLREFKHIDPTLGAIACYLYDYTGDVDSIRRMASYYPQYGQPIPFDVAYMGMLNIENSWSSHASAYIPPISGRAPSPENEKLPRWVTRSTPESYGYIAGFWPWLRQGWQFIENPESSEERPSPELKSVIPHLLPSQFTSFNEKGAGILIKQFNLRSD